CLRLLTVLPELPLLSSPRFFLCNAFLTLSPAALEYFAIVYTLVRFIKIVCPASGISGFIKSLHIPYCRIMKTLKQRIYAGETVHGCWLNLGSTVSAEIAGNAGFDWVLIDLEHGAGDLATMYHQLQVLKSCPVTSLVRTDEAARGTIQRILDSGADGIMFPQLQHIAEVEKAVNLMYYPPEGVRGMA